MYEDWDYTATATGSFTSTTTGGVGTITLPAIGTGSNQWVTVTGAGGGGGGTYYGTGTSGQIYTTGAGGPSWSDIKPSTGIVITGDGDIHRGHDRQKNKGLFQRLERLERMLGILHRDTDLEAQWEPLREIGDAYDSICDDAIRRISEVVAGELKVLQDQYEDAITQARVYIKLSRDD